MAEGTVYRGGVVIDPLNGVNGKADVRIEGARIEYGDVTVRGGRWRTITASPPEPQDGANGAGTRTSAGETAVPNDTLRDTGPPP